MTDGVNGVDVDAIRARAASATPGPWEIEARTFGYLVHGARAHVERLENAAFIANARQDVPDLLAALDQAEREIARLRAVVRTARLVSSSVDFVAGDEYMQDLAAALIALDAALAQEATRDGD